MSARTSSRALLLWCAARLAALAARLDRPRAIVVDAPDGRRRCHDIRDTARGRSGSDRGRARSAGTAATALARLHRGGRAGRREMAAHQTFAVATNRSNRSAECAAILVAGEGPAIGARRVKPLSATTATNDSRRVAATAGRSRRARRASTGPRPRSVSCRTRSRGIRAGRIRSRRTRARRGAHTASGHDARRKIGRVTFVWRAGTPRLASTRHSTIAAIRAAADDRRRHGRPPVRPVSGHERAGGRDCHRRVDLRRRLKTTR